MVDVLFLSAFAARCVASRRVLSTVLAIASLAFASLAFAAHAVAVIPAPWFVIASLVVASPVATFAAVGDPRCARRRCAQSQRHLDSSSHGSPSRTLRTRSGHSVQS